MSVAENLDAVRRRIASACESAARDPGSVTLIAVGKTFPAHVLAEALDAGVTDLGENRAQELREKRIVLGDRARWHFIGPLQTNKVRSVVGAADLIHSVDRLGLAEEIARRSRGRGSVQQVLVEVNIGGEPTKHGIEPAAAVSFAEEVAALDGIEVRGLMTIPPRAEPEEVRAFYADMASLGDELVARLPGATELSMGMTRDFEIAIEQGATMVRIGEAIFGPRRR